MISNFINVEDDFYKLLHPKLTLLIVSIDENGKPNIMTCAWNMPVSEEPPLIAIAISPESYTHELILKTREFTINIPTIDMLKIIWTAGTRSGRKTDKIKLLNLKLIKSKTIKTPIINGCIGYLECKLNKVIEAGETSIIIGEVLAAYADKNAFKYGRWNINKVKLPLHLGSKYFTIPTQIKTP